ncbi:hypothetical protein [Alloscardovia omnicolens]|uniref:hypothetical protein n=1 Tax=Alloscardovia omnicolens TaxID=419015 RepID=UPI003A63BA26
MIEPTHDYAPVPETSQSTATSAPTAAPYTAPIPTQRTLGHAPAPGSIDPRIATQIAARNRATSRLHPYAAPLYSPHSARPAVPTKSRIMKIPPAVSYTAPVIPEPLTTTYTRPWELIRRDDWYKGHGYAGTLRDTARNPWWKPLATIPIFILFYSLISLAVYVIVGFSAFGQVSFYNYQQFIGLHPKSFLNDPASPTLILLTFGGVAVMLPALW